MTTAEVTPDYRVGHLMQQEAKKTCQYEVEHRHEAAHTFYPPHPAEQSQANPHRGMDEDGSTK